MRELGLGAAQTAQNLALTLTASAPPANGQLSVDPNDDGKAAEFRVSVTTASGAADHTVTLYQRDTAGNANRADLVSDLNDALAAPVSAA